MEISELAKAHWTSGPAIEAMAIQAQAWLDKQDPKTQFSTSGLIRALGGTMNEIKPLAALLGSARFHGLMDRYFDRGKKGQFGHLTVVWHARTPMTPAEKAAQVKRDQEAAKPHDADLSDLYNEAD